jgi:hypothetical protein
MAGKPGVVPGEPPSAMGVVTLRGSSGAGRLPPVLPLSLQLGESIPIKAEHKEPDGR